MQTYDLSGSKEYTHELWLYLQNEEQQAELWRSLKEGSGGKDWGLAGAFTIPYRTLRNTPCS